MAKKRQWLRKLLDWSDEALAALDDAAGGTGDEEANRAKPVKEPPDDT